MKEFRLVAFGDSLTYGYGVLSHIAYPSRLARSCRRKIRSFVGRYIIAASTEKPPEKQKERLESQVLC